MKNTFASDVLTKPDFWGGEPDPESAQIHHGNKFSPGTAVARHWIVPNLGKLGSTQNSRNAYRLLLNILLMDILENCAHWLHSNIIKWKREIHIVLIFLVQKKNFQREVKWVIVISFVNIIRFCGLFSDSSEFYKLNCVYEFMSIFEIQSTIWEPYEALEETHHRAMWWVTDVLLIHTQICHFTSLLSE